MTVNKNDLVWHKVLSRDELHEGRVTSVTCENLTLCMSRLKGEYGALDNKCPHQGGPLGEGSIENGLLRCPWHGKQRLNVSKGPQSGPRTFQPLLPESTEIGHPN